MNTKPISKQKRSERGQSVVVMSVSLAALLLLVAGLVMASMAMFTSYAMNDPEKSSVISEWVDTTDNFTDVMQNPIAQPTATPGLGAIVGNQVYLVDPVGVNTLNGPASQ
jgi:hypothetical protein